MLAAEAGDLEAVTSLIELGANPDITDEVTAMILFEPLFAVLCTAPSPLALSHTHSLLTLPCLCD